MTRNELKAMPARDRILYLAGTDMGYPAPSTKIERNALNELRREGLIISAGYKQNSMTERFRLA